MHQSAGNMNREKKIQLRCSKCSHLYYQQTETLLLFFEALILIDLFKAFQTVSFCLALASQAVYTEDVETVHTGMQNELIGPLAI